MRLMRRVIENRLKNPQTFGARGAVTETDIIKARNQFAGFSQYPTLPASLAHNLKQIVAYANDPKWPTRDLYAGFVADAVLAATENYMIVSVPFPDVTAWRTSGKGAPGGNFTLVTTQSGNTFYRTPQGK